VWAKRLELLFSDKKHVFRSGHTLKEVFMNAYIDGQRQCITKKELTRGHWEMTYKASMGEDFAALEPFFHDKSPRRRRFRPDGRIESLTPSLEPFGVNNWQWTLRSTEVKNPYENLENNTQHRGDSRGTLVLYWGQMVSNN